jgi:hypothetical protein
VRVVDLSHHYEDGMPIFLGSILGEGEVPGDAAPVAARPATTT